MRATTFAVAVTMGSVAWLGNCMAFAQVHDPAVTEAGVFEMPEDGSRAVELEASEISQFAGSESERALDLSFSPFARGKLELHNDLGRIGLRASYRDFWGKNNTVFSYLGAPRNPGWLWPEMYLQRYDDIARRDDARFGSGFAAERGSRAFTLGYTRGDVTFERSVSGLQSQQNEILGNDTLPKLSSRSVRLSYQPAPNWTLRLSRGSVSGLDQLVPNGSEVRRTTLAATYNQEFKQGYWQTTLAWGRSARKLRESTMGYLLESTLRFYGTHVVFGRLEQVGSDDLMRENESMPRQLFKLNKLTVGYFQDYKTSGPFNFDIGALVSRHFTPSPMEPSYGSGPTAYMMFVRFKLH